MGNLVLKWVLSTTFMAASFAPTAAQTVDKFDFERFSADGSISTPLMPSAPSLPSEFDTDAYVLDASGSAVRNKSALKQTKYRNISLEPIAGSSASQTAGTSIERENKFSNLPLTPECASSSHSPTEIVELVETAAARHGVDPGFAKAIAWTESRYDQVRNSAKGARGPMQLMPETAARFGVSDACEPVANIDGGMRYLKLLLDEFRNPLLAAAAYNAGEQSVYDNGGVPPYPDTVRYVAAVLNHQLGIGIPRKRSGRGPDRQPSASTASSTTVIGARPVTFVGGVVKF